jgi:hypothetical protein
MSAANKYLDELISYGGEPTTRAEVISDMQPMGTPQPCIDRWLQGQEHAARLRAQRERLTTRIFLPRI